MVWGAVGGGRSGFIGRCYCWLLCVWVLIEVAEAEAEVQAAESLTKEREGCMGGEGLA